MQIIRCPWIPTKMTCLLLWIPLLMMSGLPNIGACRIHRKPLTLLHLPLACRHHLPLACRLHRPLAGLLHLEFRNRVLRPRMTLRCKELSSQRTCRRTTLKLVRRRLPMDVMVMALHLARLQHLAALHLACPNRLPRSPLTLRIGRMSSHTNWWSGTRERPAPRYRVFRPRP